MNNRFVTLGDEEKMMLFARTSEHTKLAVQVIEKDWWVTNKIENLGNFPLKILGIFLLKIMGISYLCSVN